MSKSGNRWKRAHTPGYQYDFDWVSMSQPKASEDRERTPDEQEAWRVAGGLPLAAREAEARQRIAEAKPTPGSERAALVAKAAQAMDQAGKLPERAVLQAISDRDLWAIISYYSGELPPDAS